MAGYMKDLGNGKFQFEVSAGRDGKGKRDKKYKTIMAKGSTPEAQRKYAEKQLALFVAEVEKGDYQAPTKYTFSGYVDEWKKNASRVLAPKTYHRYNELLKLHILPKIGGYKLETINPVLLDNTYEELRKPQKREYVKKDGSRKIKEYVLSEMTLKHIHRLIGTILQVAFRKGLLKENPITRTDAPKVKKHDPKCYDTENIAVLIEALEDANIQFKTAIHITLAAGLRLGELMGLTWDCIDFNNSTIEVKQAAQYVPGKGSFIKDPKNETSKRIISMPAPVMDLISQLEHEQKVQRVKLANKWVESNRLFIMANGTPMHPYTPSKAMEGFC